MSDKTVEISKIQIKIGDTEIELSLAECERLRAVLNELFKVKVEKECIEVPSSPVLPFNPSPYDPSRYNQPIWVITAPVEKPWWTPVTCETITSNSKNNTLKITC
ncbi:MAG: hypothetical protein WC390_06555 [Sulfurimonas sp.]|jgi:hypothetical protein